MRMDKRNPQFLWFVAAIICIAAVTSMLGKLGPFAVPVAAAFAAAAVIVLRGPLGKALAARLEQRPGGEGEAGTDPAVLEELDGLRTRLVELEERVDFAERLLARQREHDQIAGM